MKMTVGVLDHYNVSTSEGGSETASLPNESVVSCEPGAK